MAQDLSKLSDEELEALSAPQGGSQDLGALSDAELEALSATPAPEPTIPIPGEIILPQKGEIPLSTDPMQFPLEVTLTAAGSEQALKASDEAKSFQIPKAPQNTPITPERAIKGVVAGAIQVPGILQTIQDLGAETEIGRFLKSKGLEPKSTEEILTPVVGSTAASILGYEPQTIAEGGAQLLGELTSGGLFELFETRRGAKAALQAVLEQKLARQAEHGTAVKASFQLEAREAQEAATHAKKISTLEKQFVDSEGASELQAALGKQLEEARVAQREFELQLNPQARASDQAELNKLINKKAALKTELPENRLAVIDKLSQRAAQTEEIAARRARALDRRIANLDPTKQNLNRWNEAQSQLEADRLGFLETSQRQRQDLQFKLENARGKVSKARYQERLDRLAMDEHAELAAYDIEKAELQQALRGPDDLVVQKRAGLEQQKQALIKQRDMELNRLSSELKARQASLSKDAAMREKQLMKERQALITRMRLKPSGEVAEALQKKLEDITNRIAAIGEMRQAARLQPVSEGTVISGMDTILRDANDAAMKRVQMVTDAAKAKLIPDDPANIQRIAEAEYFNTLRQHGVTLDDTAFQPNGYLDQATALNQLDNKVGTDTYSVYMNTVSALQGREATQLTAKNELTQIAKKLQKLGYSPDDITYYMQYYNRDGIFDPTAKSTKSLVREQFSRIVPNKEADILFKEMRQKWSQFGLDYLDPNQMNEAYVTIVPRKGAPSKATLASKAEQGITKKRTFGYLDPELHETNIHNIIDAFSRQYATQKHIAPVLKQAQGERTKLMLLGQKDSLAHFDEFLSRTLNIKQQDFISETLATNMIQQNRELLHKLAAQTPDPDGFIKALWKESKRAVHQSWIGTKVSSVLRNVVSPLAIGAPEMGINALRRGYQSVFTPNKLSKTERAIAPKIKKLMSMQLRPDAIGELSMLDKAVTKNPIIRGLQLGGQVIDKTIGSGFRLSEKLNRSAVLRGAYLQATDTLNSGGYKALDALTKNMRNSERYFIRTAFDRQGPEAAAEAYALVRDSRVNFIYSKATSPRKFAKLIEYIPYTTFPRALMNINISSLQEGKYGDVLKRIIPVMLGMTMFEGLTGKTFTGTSQIEAALGLQGQVMPQITEPITDLAKGQPSEALKKGVSLMPIVGPLLSVVKQTQMEPLEALGFKDKDEAWIRKFISDLENMDVEEIIEP